MAYNTAEQGTPYNDNQPEPYNNDRTSQPRQYNNDDVDGWDTSSPHIDSPHQRITILLTVLLVYLIFNLIPYAIGDASGDEAIKLAGFCVALVGVVIPWFRFFFDANASHNDVLQKICGALIVIGGLLLLIGSIMAIHDRSENDAQCESDDYTCCTCNDIALLCIFGALGTIIIGADIMNDLTQRIPLFCGLFILGILFILIPLLANNDNFSDVEEAVIVGYFGVMIFAICAIISSFKGNQTSNKYIGILFGASVLLTLYAHSSGGSDNHHIMYVGIAGFIVYSLVQ